MAGARGWGRGRGHGRPRKVRIVAFRRSVGARIKGDGTPKTATTASPVQMAEEIRSVEVGSTSSASGIPKKLVMTEPMKNTTEVIPQRNVEVKAVQANETVIPVQANEMIPVQKSAERVAEIANPVGA
ncbi:hypothetical protein A4A49_02737 [Nicotiana attenuata]|uniref:Uncharacterized protein n=1 Tax=Nicotiana attenuata TaxID=49451 RepID=A0A314L1G3_NICAT|nr:hypothetical protein A4A49_02737 [Nicotiana attenuata]